MEFELKRDWQFGGGPGSDLAEKLPKGTKLGKVEVYPGSHMTEDMLADAIRRGLAGPVSTDKADEVAGTRQSKSKSKVKDE